MRRSGLGKGLVEQLILPPVEEIFGHGVARLGEEFPQLDEGDARIGEAAQEFPFGRREPVRSLGQEIFRRQGFVDDEGVADGLGKLPFQRAPGLRVGAQGPDVRFAHENGGPEIFDEFPDLILVERFPQERIELIDRLAADGQIGFVPEIQRLPGRGGHVLLQAAFLVFFPAAARTGIAPANDHMGTRRPNLASSLPVGARDSIGRS
jgi:hypothetical protein